MPKGESGAPVTMPRVSQVTSGQRWADPGPVYWTSAAAMACAVAAPLPFFWAPPLWVALLLAPPPLPALAVLGTVLRRLAPEERRTTHALAGCPNEARLMAPATGTVPIHAASQGSCGDEARTRLRPTATARRGVLSNARHTAEHAAGRTHRELSALRHRASGQGPRPPDTGGSRLRPDDAVATS